MTQKSQKKKKILTDEEDLESWASLKKKNAHSCNKRMLGVSTVQSLSYLRSVSWDKI